MDDMEVGEDEKQTQTSSITQAQSSSITHNSEKMKSYVTSALTSYFSTENQSNNGVLYTGLSESILNQIVNEVFKFSEESDLHFQFPHIKESYLNNIFHIIKSVKSIVDDYQ